MTRSLCLFLALVLAAGAPVFGESSNEPAATDKDAAGEHSESSDDEIEIEGSAATVTGALQGKDGVRIQTLCTHCNSSNIQVGGLSQELAPISRNGYPVFGGLATSMVFTILPADTVAGAQVSKGPGAAWQPAAAAGGVIRLEEAAPAELPRLDFALESGSFDRGRGTVRFAGPLSSRVSGIVVAGHETADAVDDDKDGFNDVGSVDRDFAEGRLEILVGRNHNFDVGVSWIDEENIEGRGAFDFLDALINSVPATWTREDTLFERREARAGWNWKLGNGRSLDARILDSDRDQSIVSQLSGVPDFPAPGGFIEFYDTLFERFKIEESNTWAGLEFRQPIGYDGRFTFGLEARDQEVFANSVNATDGLSEFATDGVESRSAFADFEISMGSKWDLDIGARYDDFRWGGTPTFSQETGTAVDPGGYRDRSRTSPRATLTFRPTSGWMLRWLAGTSFRAPKPIFSEICCGQEYQRNVNTDAETGRTLGMELVFQPSPDLRISTYAARTEFDDHIVKLVGRSYYYLQTYALGNVEESRADTAEVALRWKPAARLTLDGSVSWLSHRNRSGKGVPLELSLPVVTVVVPVERVPYQPVRTGSVAASLDLPGSVSLTGQASYTGEMLIQQFSPELITVPPPNPDDPLSLLLAKMRRTPGFWVAGLSLRAPLFRDLELVGGVDNLTDRLQTDLRNPTTDFNWGPLTGRSWRLGLRYSHDPRRMGS